MRTNSEGEKSPDQHDHVAQGRHDLSVSTRCTIAISPDTKTLASKVTTSKPGPSRAPMAVINFQSPAPSPRAITNGEQNCHRQPGAFQRRFGPWPACGDDVDTETKDESGHREPIRNSARPPVGPCRDQRDGERRDPNGVGRVHPAILQSVGNVFASLESSSPSAARCCVERKGERPPEVVCLKRPAVVRSASHWLAASMDKMR